MFASVLTLILVGVPMFVATNIDNLFTTLALLSDRRSRGRDILMGQYVGVLLLIIGSVAVAAAAKTIPPRFIGLMGFAPILIGLVKLRGRQTDRDDEMTPLPAEFRIGQVFSAASVTVANGGDNIGSYAPFFAIHTPVEIAIITLLFLVMTAVLFAAAGFVVTHRWLGTPIKRYGHMVMPYILIIIGLCIVCNARGF